MASLEAGGVCVGEGWGESWGVDNAEGKAEEKAEGKVEGKAEDWGRKEDVVVVDAPVAFRAEGQEAGDGRGTEVR